MTTLWDSFQYAGAHPGQSQALPKGNDREATEIGNAR